MNQPSHYQTAFFDELASREDVELRVIYARGQSAERSNLGWEARGTEGQGYMESVLSRENPVIDALRSAWTERRARHLINGVWAERPFVFAAVALAALRAKFFFHSESPNPSEERRGVARRLKHAFGRWIVARSRGIFLIGAKGCRYYQAMGVPEHRFFKFSYFIGDRPRRPRRKSEDGRWRMIYLGQYVERKRVGDLIGAVQILRRRGLNLSLRIVGAGPCADGYRRQVEDCACADIVSIEGPVSPAKVPDLLESCDVLVLPSGFDGWGLTVNEALHAGISVVVSDGCGVAEILSTQRGWGEVFPAGDMDALVGALERIGKHPESYRPEPGEVDRLIGCRRMTDYFLDCVRWALADSATAAKPRLDW